VTPDVPLPRPAPSSPRTNGGDLQATLLQLAGKKRGARGIVSAAERRLAARDGHASPVAVALAQVALVSEVLAALALDHGWSRAELADLLEELARTTGLPAEAVAAHLHAQTARDPRLIELSPAVAAETHLRMLYALAPVEEVSLWRRAPDGGLTCVFRLGLGSPSRRVRWAARRALEPEAEAGGALVQSVPVLRWQQPCAALVVRSSREGRGRARSAAEETAAALSPVLEREDLLARSSGRERALVAAGERLLVRFGLDLHDGPLQELAALAGELRRLRDDLTIDDVLDVPESALAQIADLEERLVVLDGSLREIVTSLDSPSLARHPVADLVEREVGSFAAQSDIDASVSVTGDVDGLTASQRIALFRIVQESLANVREHSAATSVSVSVAERRGHVRAEISDNGRGFDVERTLVRAARNARMGLVGMSERARLLGGRFDICSSPGGPTTVSVTLPAWRPVDAPEAVSSQHSVRAG
jgi:signal transduction histidine kinase